MTKRILILDEDALVMVVDKDVVHQVDERRGEMTRTEFVNFLIQNQLKERPQNHVSRDEFYHFTQEMKTTMRSLLEFFLSYGLNAEERKQNQELNTWLRKIQALDYPTPETDTKPPS